MAMRVLRGGDKLQAELSGIGRSLQGGLMRRLLNRVLGRAKALPALRVGFLEGATYPDGTPVAAVAQYNEFGTSRIPPRPFMRNAISEHSHEWGKLLGAALKMTDGDVDKALDVTAEKIVLQIQDSIREGAFAPLVQSTIDARLRPEKRAGRLKTVNMETAVKPLIDTGHMLDSVGYEVSDDD